MSEKSGANKEKRKLKSFSIVEKISILVELDQGSTINSLVEKYGVPRRTLRNWVTNKENMKEQARILNLSQNIKRIRKSPFDDLDDAIYFWFDRCVKNGISLTGPAIMAKAKELHQEFRIETPFNASEGWLTNWKKKFSIRQYTRSGEKLSADVPAANVFKIEFEKTIADEQLSLCQIFNAVETGLNFKQMPKKTLAEKSSTAPPGLKMNKDRVTVMVCTNADGSLKLPLMVIGKSAKPRAIKNIMASLPVYYASNKSAWMTPIIFEKWFREEFVPRVTEFLRGKNIPVKAVLLLDNAPCHPSVEILEEGDIKVKYLPRNTTSLIQPMDQGVIENLKRHYRSFFSAAIILSEKNGKNFHDFLRSVTIKDVIDWFTNAWINVKAQTIFKCWKNLLPASFYSCTIDSINDIENAEILDNLRRISEFERVDEAAVQDWISSDDEENSVPSNAELFEMMSVHDESQDIQESTSKDIDPAEAVSATNTLLEFFRCNQVLRQETLIALIEAKQAAVRIAISK